MVAPRSVPREILHVDETSAPLPLDMGGLRVLGGTGNSTIRNGVLDSIGRGLNVVVPLPPPSPSVPPPRVSRMMEGNLIYRVQPQYPPLARQARVQGIVVLRAMISREGKIASVHEGVSMGKEEFKNAIAQLLDAPRASAFAGSRGALALLTSPGAR